MTTPVLDQPAVADDPSGMWALVQRTQQGDTQAFGAIYDRYVDTVFRFIYFRIGNKPWAEDLTSDVFLRALKKIHSFTWQGRDLAAWLITIARNTVADYYKSGRYRLEVTTGDVLDADREDSSPEASPENAVLDYITNVALLTAVKQLNPEQQECIVLRYLQQFSVAETAVAMGKGEGAVKALSYRAVRALARALPEGFLVEAPAPPPLPLRQCRKCPRQFAPPFHHPATRVCPACHADKERFGSWQAVARERFGDPKDVRP